MSAELLNTLQPDWSRPPRVAVVAGPLNAVAMAVARRLAEEGCELVLASPLLGDETERQALALATTTGATVVHAYLEATTSAAARRLVEEVEERHGSLDILVNSPHAPPPGDIVECGDEEWAWVHASLVTGVFTLIRAALPGMLSRGHGRIVNIAPPDALVATRGAAACTSAAHAVLGLTRAVALEVAGRGITCNVVCATPAAVSESAASAGNASNPEPAGGSCRCATGAEDIAAVTAFLCGDDARSLNGAAMALDLAGNRS